MGHCQLREGLVPSSLWKPLGPRLARAADTRVTPLSCVKVAGDFFPYPVCLTDGIFDSFVDCERATHTCRLAHWWTPLRVDGLPREVVSSLRMIGPCFLATWRFEDKAIWNDGPRCPQSMSTSISECHFPLRYTEIRSSSLNPLYDTVLVSLFQILRVGHEKLPPSSRCKDSKETRTSTLARVGLDGWLPDAKWNSDRERNLPVTESVQLWRLVSSSQSSLYTSLSLSWFCVRLPCKLGAAVPKEFIGVYLT